MKVQEEAITVWPKTHAEGLWWAWTLWVTCAIRAEVNTSFVVW